MEHALALLIPILAVGGWIIPVTVKSILKSQERRMEMQLQAQQSRNDAVSHEIAALRAEVSSLRDTSTQFDMSLEQSVQRLEQRLGHMETRTAASSTDEAVQRVGLR